ncbi:hypothetical protein JCM18750_17600 [Halostagnicola bangensis]
MLERLFAGKPRGDTTPPFGPYGEFEKFYENLLDKRGTIHIADWMPGLSPGNLPFVLAQWASLFVLTLLFVVTLYVVPLPEGSLDISLVLLLPLFVTKHASTVATWTEAGRYERASVTTVRPRAILYTVLVGFLAFLFLATQQDAHVGQIAAATTLLVVPKLLLDFREAGIGPNALIFDPSSETTASSVSVPPSESRYVFLTDRRAVFSRALYVGCLYTVYPGLLLIGAVGLVGVLPFNLAVGPAVVTIAIVGTLLLSLSVVGVVVWLGHAFLEYRVYDDSLVAYDRYLEEPQWVVSFEDVTTVETTPPPLVFRHFPFVDVSIKLERISDQSLRIEYLEQPRKFARVVSEMMSG